MLLIKQICYLILFSSIFFTPCIAQKATQPTKKGQFYFYWGYNRAFYSPSNITFKGKGYNFTLFNIIAKDRPTPLGKDYYNPLLLSIPQFNIRFGYFITPHIALSIGTDHMKYVMVRNQKSTLSGHISNLVSTPDIEVSNSYVGNFNHDSITIQNNFLTFEHTDGYNFPSIEADYFKPIWTAKNQVQQIMAVAGIGVGLIVPRTDVRLFGVGQNNYWNIAGWGASVKMGIQTNISKHFFVRADVKAGISRLNHIRTTGRSSDYAQQNINFLEGYAVFGYRLNTKNEYAIKTNQ